MDPAKKSPISEATTGPDTATPAPSANRHAILIMLVSLVIAAALVLCVARRTYPRDVATAMASEAATAADTSREPTLQPAGMV
jgi:hypothetical protein